MAILGWLLKLVNPLAAIAKEIAADRARLIDAKTESERLQVEENIQTKLAQRDILIAEQGHWFTRWVRPAWAAPFVIITWKIVVYDNALGLGVTDPLSPEMYELMKVIAASYFIGRGLEKGIEKGARAFNK